MWKSFALSLLHFSNVFCNHWPPNIAKNLSDGDSFDFIVVGSGSGGSSVAGRLAQRNQTVLLVEAGGEPPLSTVIPGMSPSNLMSNLDWQFIYEYDHLSCQSLLDKRCHQPRGKVLGGSSAINYMMYVRGNKADYSDWNIPSWTYDKMLPYFLRMESLTDYNDLPTELKRYHNHDGPLRVSHLNISDVSWRNNVINAYQEIGLKRNQDYNGPSQIGISVAHVTVFAGERQSAAEAYLVPLSRNINLSVAYNSYVTKVIIDDNKITQGIKVSIEGNKEITIIAKKEVILSAGTINTPKILMFSGIGPKFELKKNGVQVQVDNPHVGENLQDHPMIPVILTANTGTANISLNNSMQALLDQWLFNRSGLLTTMSIADIIVFVDTFHNSSVPDVQFMHSVMGRSTILNSSGPLKSTLGFNDAIIKDIQELNSDSEVLAINLILLRSNSKGSIHLASSDPRDPPVIYGNLMTGPEDYSVYLRGIRLMERLLSTKTFVENGVKIPKINSMKECNAYKFRSDDYWLCYHKQLGGTNFHPVGTASIGRVVDEKLRVFGVRGLRVVDASIMVLVPRGNTNAPTIAIGERAADFIAEDHGF